MSAQPEQALKGGLDIALSEAPPPADDMFQASRLAAVDATELVVSASEGAFERLTRLAALLLDAPLAFVTVVDTTRSWYRTCVGLGPHAERFAAVEASFCRYVVEGDAPLVLDDARADPRTRENSTIVGIGIVAVGRVPHPRGGWGRDRHFLRGRHTAPSVERPRRTGDRDARRRRVGRDRPPSGLGRRGAGPRRGRVTCSRGRRARPHGGRAGRAVGGPGPHSATEPPSPRCSRTSPAWRSSPGTSRPAARKSSATSMTCSGRPARRGVSSWAMSAAKARMRRLSPPSLITRYGPRRRAASARPGCWGYSTPRCCISARATSGSSPWPWPACAFSRIACWRR
jgi:hypothetical protein